MSEEKFIEKVVMSLTDLRLSLPPEERAVLDKIVVIGKAEVTGHKFEMGDDWRGRIAIDNERYKVEF